MNEGTKEQGYGNSRNRAPTLNDLPKFKRQQHPNSKKNTSGGKHGDPEVTTGPPQGKNNDPQQKRKDKKQNKRQLQLAAMKKKADDEDRYFKQCQAQRHVPQRLSTEKELFGGSTQGAQGINFGKYNDIKVEVKRANDASSVQFENFDTLSLHPTLRLNISRMNYTAPTPIQKHSIPLAMEGDDLMCCAQTGSGKTCAFLLPVVSQLLNAAAGVPATKTGPAQPRCVILAPTRELAIQIELEAQKLCFSLPQLHPVTVYGGVNAKAQLKELAFGAHIIVATPGRLTDFVDRNLVSLSKVQYLVLDEADRMLDMGFEPQIRKLVLQSGMTKKEERQTFMFSATFEPAIQKLAATFLRNDYTWIAVGRVGSTTDSITQVLVQATADKRMKLSLVVKAIEEGPTGRTLVFVQKKRTATWLKKQLLQGGPPDGNFQNFTKIIAEDIHGDRSQSQREAALLKFREGTCRVLVATDVAARGLDIAGVEHVINMDLPTSVEDFDSYVHRIGRTGRVGHTGLATSLFVNELNDKIASRLVQQLKGAKQDVPKWLEDMVAGGGGVARSGFGGGAPQKKAVTGGGRNRAGGGGVSRKEALAGGGVLRSGGGGVPQKGAASGGGAVDGNHSGRGGASKKGAASGGGAGRGGGSKKGAAAGGGAINGNRSGGGGAPKRKAAAGGGGNGNRSGGGGASKKKAAPGGGGVNP